MHHCMHTQTTVALQYILQYVLLGAPYIAHPLFYTYILCNRVSYCTIEGQKLTFLYINVLYSKAVFVYELGEVSYKHAL